MSEPDPKQSSVSALPIRKVGELGSTRNLFVWLVIWIAAHLTTFWIADAYFLSTKNRDGFAAAMGMLIWLYPTLGILASYFVARIARRDRLFLVGAPAVGFGVGATLLATGGSGLALDLVSCAWLALAAAGAVTVFRDRSRRRARA